MLSEFDLDIIARDRALKTLDVLLDYDKFERAFLDRFPRFRNHALSLTHLRYTPGHSCLTCYRIDNRPHQYVCGFIRKNSRAIQFSLFPNDKELTAGKNPDFTRRELIKELLPCHPYFWNGILEEIRYKPRHRYTARLTNGASHLLLKFYTAKNYIDLQHRMNLLSNLVGPLTYNDKHRMVALKWVEGVPLSDVFHASNPNSLLMETVGSSLGSLHQIRPVDDIRHRQPSRYSTIASRIAFILPALQSRLAALNERIERMLQEPVTECVIHSDFYSRNIIVGQQISFAALDAMRIGDPARDTGRFIADLEAHQISGCFTQEQTAVLKQRFLKGYGALEPFDETDRSLAHAACALLRIAFQTFCDRASDWPNRVETIVQRAESLIGITQPCGYDLGAIPAPVYSDGNRMRHSEDPNVADCFPLPGPVASNPFVFVVGCPRSGTTLLQRMLDAHPELCVANDTHFIPLLAPSAADSNRTISCEMIDLLVNSHRFQRLGLSEMLVRSIAGKFPESRNFISALYSAFAKAHAKRLAGEKTPDYVRHIPLLHAFFPSSKFIHLIRDGRDVALSVKEWVIKKAKGPAQFEAWSSNPLGICALWWKWQVTQGRREGNTLGPELYCELKYEDLIQNPEEALAPVMSFLGLPFDSAMIHYHEGRKKGPRLRSAKRAWLPPTPGLRNWREQMPPRELQLFEVLAGELLGALNYDRAFYEIPEHVKVMGDQLKHSWMTELQERQKNSVQRRGVYL